MKTSALQEHALDWAVAKAAGVPVRWDSKRKVFLISDLPGMTWKPSDRWTQGGPIIEREFIYLKPSHNHTRWRAYTYDGKGQGIQNNQFGPTPMVAAMRCFVASVLGDEVELPEALR